MSDAVLEQVIDLALKLTLPEQAKLLERVATHLAQEVAAAPDRLSSETLTGQAYEVWSPQDEGGAVAALNQVLQDYKKQKRAQNAE